MNRPPPRPPASSAGDGTVAGLLHLLAATRPGADAELIKRAYETATYWHRGQQRKSGDAYITHPVAVASILAEVGADDQTLCAALLHDTLHGTSYRLASLREEFGAEIAGLVTGAMALDAPTGGEITPSDTRSASTMASGCDTRMVAIKLADRLHNMRTLRHLPPTAQVRASSHTLRVLVPAARRLGLEAIRSELENLAAGALKQYGFRAATVSGRLLATAAALLPSATRTRWREEWLGELSVLPTRRERVTFAVHILAGMPRLAVTLRRRAHGKQARPQ
jgi:(p)ppGpp synthase/HD superfamily hydrolase